MGAPQKIDHEKVARLKMEMTWPEVAEAVGHPNWGTLASAHRQWVARTRKDAGEATGQAREDYREDRGSLDGFNDYDTFTKALTGNDLPGLTCLEDVALFFDVDTDVWEVADFGAKGNTWQNKAKGEPVTNLHQYEIRARFRRRREVLSAALGDAFCEVVEALETLDLSLPEYPALRPGLVQGEHLCEIAIHDAHFGMLSWAPETGESYDLQIATDDYVEAGQALVDIAVPLYAPERFLYVVGHDLSHIDGMLEGKIPVTNRGTPQDLDSRLPKIIRAIVSSVVKVATHAAAFAPVDIVIVRGNHDKHLSFYVGEILRSLFMNHERIRVQNEPRDLVFYSYGANTLGLCHGEKILRKKDTLPLTFADECPPEMWISSAQGCREIHTGHFHKRMGGGYYPRGEVDESRGIVTRALPGLTATDAWHKEMGYRHRRAASLLAFSKEGGLAGIHEVTP